MLNIGQNKLWLEAHNYKRLISIFEEVASELLFDTTTTTTKNNSAKRKKNWGKKNTKNVEKK